VLVQTVRHFFPNLNDWLQALPDSRAPELCTYPTRFLAWWGLALYLFQLASRRQLNFKLNACGTQVLANLNRLAGTQQKTRPVHGTLDHFLEHVPPAAFAQVRTRMVRHLIRSKVLEPARLLGYLPVTLDATGLFYFRQRHCPQCLSQRHGETTIYLHNVLEAKLLGPSDLVLSIASEFIKNSDAGTTASRPADAIKQDCELNAFSRLAPQLHQEFPQLRLCLTVDSLYACGRFFQACQDYGWAFVVVFKPTVLPTLWQEFQSLLPLVPNQRVERLLPDSTQQVYRWVNDLSYVDSAGRAWTLSALQCQESDPDHQGQETSTFAWLTMMPVNAQTVEAIANQGGRARWKIENQGFNRQKNSDLNLQHLYSTDPEKLKAYYYLLQIACILLHLLEQGSLLRRLAKDYGRTPWQLFGSLKNLAWLLLESIRCFEWPALCYDAEAAARQRISFAPFNTS
jgi:hypothetical protein